MLAELQTKSQITLPKSYVDDLIKEVNHLRDDIHSGRQPVFDNIDTLLEKLEEE